jgi:hypothetical protein
VLVSENAYTRPPELVWNSLMRPWIIILIIGIAGTAFGRLGDTEAQLTKRYGKPTSVRPGGKFNPYFDKWLDFQTQGVAISCGIHAGKCVTIQYNRQRGFVNAEFVGFKMFNDVGSPIYAERSATSLKFTFKKDYPEILKASQKGISRMRKTLEPPQKAGQ